MSGISIATIDKPEFINLQPLDINPLMSQCDIKVLYVGQNRNQTYITKEVATEMAKTLRGAPIVGYYSETQGDFTDHGDRITIDNEGVKFEKLTRPYGFVSPNAEVWFQNFEDTDEFGNKVVHEYLMTTGFLWTGQYEEANLPLRTGNPQSMELDENSLQGHWATDNNSGIEFFIINDAIFSKLCILGQNVEPCFEGANVTAPQISASFSLDDNFKHTLFNMMQQLQFALKGGQQMHSDMDVKVGDESIQDIANFSASQDNSNESAIDKNQTATEEQNIQTDTSYTVTEGGWTISNIDVGTLSVSFEDSASAGVYSEETESADGGDEISSSDPAPTSEMYHTLSEQYTALKQNFDKLQSDYQSLVDFKNQVEDEKKDTLINSFYMLSDEDKQDVINHKSEYSLDDIEAKLSVICVRKKVNFNLDDTEEKISTTKAPATQYILEDTTSEVVPAWISALRNTKNSRNN